MSEFKNQGKQLQSHAGHIPHQLKAAAVLQDNRNQAGAAPVITDNRPAQLAVKPNNTGLPNQLKAGIESLSGMSMDHVKVHYNSSQPAQLNAHAYAQGSEIHVAPGQEKHLPHEAWHVVQQAKGRVKPTHKTPSGVSVNDNKGLEAEADYMGSRALGVGAAQLKAKSSQIGLKGCQFSGISHHTAQLKNARQANILGPTYALTNGATALYNNARVPTGNLYSKNIAVAANGIGAVTAAQIAESAQIGAAATGITWLDAVGNLPAAPNAGNWAGGAAAYITNIRTRLDSLAAAYDADYAWQNNAVGRAAAMAFVGNFAIPRQPVARDLMSVGAIDPFITRISITTPNGQVWIYETNYSNSAFAYITSITDPTLGRSAHIIPEEQFAAQRDTPLADAADPFTFSSGHVRNERSIAEQLDHVGNPNTKGQFHERLDAQTKVIAEGARFIPIRNAGTALRANSRFYGTIPAGDDDYNYRFVNYTILTNRWSTWFNRAFNITAATMLAAVDQHGDPAGADPENIPRPGIDYDLQNDHLF